MPGEEVPEVNQMEGEGWIFSEASGGVFFVEKEGLGEVVVNLFSDPRRARRKHLQEACGTNHQYREFYDTDTAGSGKTGLQRLKALPPGVLNPVGPMIRPQPLNLIQTTADRNCSRLPMTF